MKRKNFFIPTTEEFHHKVKVYCATKNVSISELIMDLLQTEMLKIRKGKEA